MSLPSIGFALFEPYAPWLSHAIFTRHGGVSKTPFDSLNVSYGVGDDPAAVMENRRRCAAVLGCATSAITVAGLVHGARVARADGEAPERQLDSAGIIPDVDALIAQRSGQGLLITAADCLPVLVVDPRHRAIGLAHAGWRGLAAGVLGETIAAMTAAFGSDPLDLRAGIGPGLGPCCARFSDPARELPPRFGPYILPNHHVDLWAAARGELARAGLPPGQVEQQELCTVCNRDRFFSHRGDLGRTGRFAAVLVLRGGDRAAHAVD